VFPLGRPVEPDRLIDLKEFAAWVQEGRKKRGWSLEILARYISDAGYPISQNKLYRIEQHLKDEHDQKRPLKTIDYELKMRLETVLGERFVPKGFEPADRDDLVSAAGVIEMIRDIKANKTASQPPDDPIYRRIYDAVKEAVFSNNA
jgi:hypothetical protein